MIEWCLKHGLPEPEFEDTGTSFIVTIRKDIYTEDYLKKLDLNERQVKAIMFVKKEGKITNKEYRNMFKVSTATAKRELQDLVKKGIYRTSGAGPNFHYLLK